MLNNVLSKLKTFTQECVRVLKVTRKPNNEELKIIVKISGIGIIVIGIIGFIIQMLWQFLQIK
jgi:protein transport protein SEC61 subunit gamma-like protein